MQLNVHVGQQIRQQSRHPVSLTFRDLLTVVLLSTLLLAGASRLSAQAVSGNLIGTVTDATGAPVANAKITITSIDKGIAVSTATNESGNYSQTQLVPGNYRLAVEA